jgi:hypothetical protein
MITQLTVGQPYTRADIDRALGTDSFARSREGIVYLADRGVALFLVTLDKQGRGEALTYNDWFEDDFFHWDSQNQQHFDTPRVQDMVTGRLTPHLLARVHQRVDGVTQPFIYAGELAYSSHQPGTRNPVHIIWEAAEFQDAPNDELRAIYVWRPANSGGITARASVGTRVSKRRSAGQGYNQNPVERMLIEQRAVVMAKDWYASQGHAVVITATQKSWDLECTASDGRVSRVEVKGTVGGPNAVFLTSNEVKAAQEDGIPTDLFIVHGIRLERGKLDGVVASGGIPVRIPSWIPSAEHLRPTEYRYSVPVDLLEPV